MEDKGKKKWLEKTDNEKFNALCTTSETRIIRLNKSNRMRLEGHKYRKDENHLQTFGYKL